MAKTLAPATSLPPAAKTAVLPDADSRLMLAYAAGDVAAFEALHARYRGPLYRYFLRQCRRPELAEELYQECWMRVVRARRTWRPTAKFNTWLFRIAHNLLIDAFRSEAGRATEPLEQEPAGAERDNPEALSEDRERLGRFRRLLEALPVEQREVFLLKEEGGLSLDEIASLLNIGFEAAKSRLRYAVGKLRAGLREHDEGEGHE